ncbi:Exonuclease 1 [Platanthera zijinensis]|uniref:Exonuclease 1 n=1 Tax=Platanthera zijinensis TaxID=2320716 RepID=A0AAP0ASP9_9ASPA
MCVLSGCDFLPSISGIGTKRAYCLVNKYKNLERVLSTLKFDKRYQMPQDYADSFWRAIAVFHHARIYDAKSKSLKPLKPLEQKYIKALNGELDLLGPELPGPIAAAIAEGRLNPVTMEAFSIFTEAKTLVGGTPTDSWILITLADKEQPFVRPACVPQANEGMQNLESEKRIFTDIKANIENIQDGSYDQEKYAKEARALGRLVVPTKRHQSLSPEIVRPQVPNNNPFKKRKLEACGLKVDSCCEDAEKSAKIFSSSTNLVGMVETEAEIVASTVKHKLANIFKEARDDKEVVNNKRHSLFRFFERL